jgi:hypothetical protein
LETSDARAPSWLFDRGFCGAVYEPSGLVATWFKEAVIQMVSFRIAGVWLKV